MRWEIYDRRPLGDTGAVKKDVNLTKFIHGAVHHLLNALRIRYIAENRQGPSTHLLYLPGYVLEYGQFQTADNDIHTIGRQAQGYSFSQGA